MTKKTKKLSLNKETLTTLNEAALARAAGGSDVCMGFNVFKVTTQCPTLARAGHC